ncbi:MAG: ABC transporter permease [Acidobacteriota bacterium]
MLAYQIRMAFLSLRRNPYLSTLLIAGIAVGIAVATSFVTIHHLMGKDPLPSKSSRVVYVQVDAWDPDGPYDDDNPTEPPDQLTYRDARALLESDIPTHQSAMFKAQLTVHPEEAGARPFRAMTRMCTGGFFPMFEVPFLYGGGWNQQADDGPEQVAVLSFETNVKLFGGDDSVGRRVRIEDRDFTVVGVMAPWSPSPKFYDTLNGAFDPAEEIYLPFRLVEPMEIDTAGNTNGWKFWSGTEFEEFLETEYTWVQMWAQVDTPEQRDRYMAFLNAYAQQQKDLGRHGRPINNRLKSVTEWLDFQEVVAEEVTSLALIAVLFLVVCAFNLIGILLGKFLARAPEVGVRRALGASKASVFLQHLIECQVIGVLGGVFGLLLATLSLRVIGRMVQVEEVLRLDFEMAVLGILMSLGAAFVAGTYPAWRICRIAPAAYLKLQ